MVIVQRAGVDHGDVAFANNVGAGARIGEGAWVRGNDSANIGGDFINNAGFELDVSQEGNVCHGLDVLLAGVSVSGARCHV